jgi:hypothetical protein
MSPASIPVVKLADGHNMPILGLGTWKVSFGPQIYKLDIPLVLAVMMPCCLLNYKSIVLF